MRCNLGIVEYIVEEGSRRGYRFSAVTNGVELGSFLHLLRSGQITFLQITLDGPPEVHDRCRFRADGSGTFADITENITAALETGARVSVRTNVDQRNIEHVQELADICVAYRWPAKDNFVLYCHPVLRKAGERKPTDLSLQQLSEKLTEYARKYPGIRMVDVGVSLEAKFLGLLATGTYALFYPVSCGSNLGMYLFDPHGDVHVCWDCVGEDVGRVGRYVPKLVIYQESLEQWRNRTIMSIPQCRACKYALLCGGGCSAFALDTHGTLLAPHCDDFGPLFEKHVPRAYARYKSEFGATSGKILPC